MLTDDDRALLDFEALPWRSAAAKEVRAREELDVSATRYYARLNALIDTRAAEEYAPGLVHRLRRIRALRAQARGRRLDPVHVVHKETQSKSIPGRATTTNAQVR